jgi:hypothetical protein
MARRKLRSPWTAEEDALLLQLFNQGKSPTIVAGRLRRSVATINVRRRKLMPLAIFRETRPSPRIGKWPPSG